MLLRFFAILNMSEFYSSPKYALRINGFLPLMMIAQWLDDAFALLY